MKSQNRSSMFDANSQVLSIDVLGIRLLEDRVLVRDLGEDEKIGSIIIPATIRERYAVGKDGLLRQGVVVAVGPGDRFSEHGLDAQGSVRRRLLTKPCHWGCKGRTTKWCKCWLCFHCGHHIHAHAVNIQTGEKTSANHSGECFTCGEKCPGWKRPAKLGRIPVVVPPQCRVGEKILYDRRRETEYYVDGVRYSMIHAEQSVLAVLED